MTDVRKGSGKSSVMKQNRLAFDAAVPDASAMDIKQSSHYSFQS